MLEMKQATSEEEAVKSLIETAKAAPYIITPYLLGNKENTLFLLRRADLEQEVGCISLYDIDGGNQSAYIDGFVSHPDYVKDLVSGLVSVICRGFEEMGLNRIAAVYSVGNSFYRHIYDHLRFMREGILRQSVNIQGQFYNLQVRGMLKYEYEMNYLSGNNIERICNLEGF